jgi:hypothetical protein
MSVPEATVHEDNSTESRQHEIGSTRKPFDVQSVPEAFGVKCAPDEQFRSGILLAHQGRTPR